MATYITYLNWTDQGIRNVKDSPNRSKAAKELLKSMGGEVRRIFLTTGARDIVLISEAPDGDVMSKFALALGAQGNVRSTTVRAWSEEEFEKMVSELP